MKNIPLLGEASYGISASASTCTSLLTFLDECSYLNHNVYLPGAERWHRSVSRDILFSVCKFRLDKLSNIAMAIYA